MRLWQGVRMLTPAPVDPAALADALLPFGRSRTLPAAAYTDEAVLAWERRHLFAGAWTCLGRLDDLAERGRHTSRALTVGDVGVLLTFPTEPVRGVRQRLPAPRPRTAARRRYDGGSRAIVCPYHGWAYRLDGTLRTAPGMAEQPTFDPTDHGLVELPVRELARLGVRQRDRHARRRSTATWARWTDLVAPYRPAELVPRRAAHATRSPRTGR